MPVISTLLKILRQMNVWELRQPQRLLESNNDGYENRSGRCTTRWQQDARTARCDNNPAACVRTARQGRNIGSLDEAYLGLHEELLYACKTKPVEVLNRFVGVHYFGDCTSGILKFVKESNEASHTVNLIWSVLWKSQDLVMGYMVVPKYAEGNQRPYVVDTFKLDDNMRLVVTPAKTEFSANSVDLVEISPNCLEFGCYSLNYEADKHMSSYAKKIVGMYNQNEEIDQMLSNK
ncbi:hypothetical protein HHK36_022431 [Tetracentron sinense]|uniref:Uncharacterized protein n=1 Tax=Tetracentron sinense TaxID=13715 RepID=A0A834YPU1_TETSI|nr:hypothetical protein HHK36_022431 [Tetracentron sinense]